MSKLKLLSRLAIAGIAVSVVVLLLLSVPASAAKGPLQKGKGGGGKDKSSNPVMHADFRDVSTDRILSDGDTYLTGEMFGTGNFGLHLEETASRALTMDFMDQAGENGNPALPFVLATEQVFFRNTKVTFLDEDICVDPTLPCIPIGESRRSTLGLSWTDANGVNWRVRFNDDAELGGELVQITRTALGTWEIAAGTEEARVTSTGPKGKGKRVENDHGLFKMPFLVTVTCDDPPSSVGLPCQ